MGENTIGLTTYEMGKLKKESFEFWVLATKQKEQKLMKEASRRLLLLGYIPIGLEPRRNVRAKRVEQFRHKYKDISNSNNQGNKEV